VGFLASARNTIKASVQATIQMAPLGVTLLVAPRTELKAAESNAPQMQWAIPPSALDGWSNALRLPMPAPTARHIVNTIERPKEALSPVSSTQTPQWDKAPELQLSTKEKLTWVFGLGAAAALIQSAYRHRGTSWHLGFVHSEVIREGVRNVRDGLMGDYRRPQMRSSVLFSAARGINMGAVLWAPIGTSIWLVERGNVAFGVNLVANLACVVAATGAVLYFVRAWKNPAEPAYAYRQRIADVEAPLLAGAVATGGHLFLSMANSPFREGLGVPTVLTVMGVFVARALIRKLLIFRGGSVAPQWREGRVKVEEEDKN
jgi:hypothetical protein